MLCYNKQKYLYRRLRQSSTARMTQATAPTVSTPPSHSAANHTKRRHSGPGSAVIAASPHLAAEHPVRIAGVGEDDR
jgi:hypothetical protein